MTIHSEKWNANANFTNLGFQPETVNHSKKFIDPESGTHTQTIELL